MFVKTLSLCVACRANFRQKASNVKMKSTHTRVFDVGARAGYLCGGCVSVLSISVYFLSNVDVVVLLWCWLTDDIRAHTRTRLAAERNGLFRTMCEKLDEFLINFYADLFISFTRTSSSCCNQLFMPTNVTLQQRTLCHRPTDISHSHVCLLCHHFKITLKRFILSAFAKHSSHRPLVVSLIDNI